MLCQIFLLNVFLPLSLYLEKVIKVKNVGPPAEGYLRLEGAWPVGLRLGFVSLDQLDAGAFVGMKTFNFIFVLTLTAFIFTVVPASV
jgi:hypothetical protein